MQTQGIFKIPSIRHSRESGNPEGNIMNASVLLPKIQELVQNEKERLIREQITSWVVGFASGQSNIRDFYGKESIF